MLEMICKELGVEIGEIWTGNDGFRYCILSNGNIGIYEDDTSDGYLTLDVVWADILNGTLKPVWKPKDRERYYIPRMNYEMYDDWCWVNDKNDNWWLENSMIFKTKEEAIECANRMLKTVREYQHEIS